ncbi:MAG TPA: prepilin-type N-terminal cleavage/methylation domain-containing protein [Rhodanobacteraceae bacterium]|nr:prepilin-type N-terminal cleavage/methylation domain-containing protein [Rhodanobacteraceae bacterium]
MSTILPTRCLARRANRNRGFTLIELMIAMLLGLIVIAGVTSVFLAGQQSFRTNNALGDVEDGSRIAFELMSRDIREAGLTGCDSTSDRIANVLNNKGTDWWADWGNALHGYGGANSNGTDGDVDQADPAVTTGTGVGQRVAGTDSLEIISAGNLPVTIQEDKEPAANFKLNAPSTTLQSGDVIIVCSPDHATIVQISNYNNANVTVVHNTGNVVSPGNCSKGLGYPSVCTTNGNLYTFPPNSTIAGLSVSDWYIGKNPAGTRSLYRIALVNTSGTGVSTQAQEMVRNVNDMQITYLQNPNTSFVPAASVTDWGAVIAARVTLDVQSTFKRASVKGDQAIARTYSATTTVRNRVE